MRTPILVMLGLAMGLVACDSPSGPSTGGDPPDPSPAPIVDADIRIASAQYVTSGLRVAFRNHGGPGAFRMRAWGIPFTPTVCPCPADPYTRLIAETEAIEVAGGWEEAGLYNISSVYKLTIISRNTGSINWRETHTYRLQQP